MKINLKLSLNSNLHQQGQYRFSCLKHGIETVRKQDIHVVTKDTLDHIFIYPQSVILDHVQI